MLQCIIYNKGGVFRACLSGTPSLPVTACGAEKPQIWMYVHILHYTFLLLFMQTSSLSKFEVLGALSKLTNFTLVSRKNIVSNNKWHIVHTSPRYIYVLIWKTPNILRAAYFSDTFLFGKTITKPLTHICTSAVMKIKIYYVYAYQELFTLNEYTIFLDIDIVHDT